MDIMQIIILWVISIVLSYGMKLSQELRMFKDAADAGYKIDLKKMTDFNHTIYPDELKREYVKMLIMGVNILQVLMNTVKYNNNRSAVLTQLDVMGALESMNDDDLKRYQEKPTGFNALVVTVLSDDRILNSTNITFPDGSVIYYNVDDETNNINILKVIGPMSELSIYEQKMAVKDSIGLLLKKGAERYGSRANTCNEIRKNEDNEMNNTTLSDYNENIDEKHKVKTYTKKMR